MAAAFDGIDAVSGSAVICEQGDRMNGWVWWLANGEAHYVFNHLGERRFQMSGAVPTDSSLLTVTAEPADADGVTTP